MKVFKFSWYIRIIISELLAFLAVYGSIPIWVSGPFWTEEIIEQKWSERKGEKREKIFSFLLKEERSLEWEQLTTKLWGKDLMGNETNILPLWWEGFLGLDGGRSEVAGQGNQLGRNTHKCRANTLRPCSLTPCKHVSNSQPFTCGSPARQVPRGYQFILSPLCLAIHKLLSNLWGINSKCLWGNWGRRLKGYLNGKKSSGRQDGRETRKGP